MVRGIRALELAMPKNILIADDDPAMLKLYSRIFAGKKHSITLADSVKKAAGLIDANDYDLLITDLMFPDGLGTELARRFAKKHSKGRSLLVTGSQPGTFHFDTTHVAAWFGKPIDLDIFMDAVSKALA